MRGSAFPPALRATMVKRRLGVILELIRTLKELTLLETALWLNKWSSFILNNFGPSIRTNRNLISARGNVS